MFIKKTKLIEKKYNVKKVNNNKIYQHAFQQ